MLQEKLKTIVPLIKPHSLGRKLTLNCITVKISPEEWELCDEFSKQMWSQTKTNTAYGRGILNTNKDPAKVERTGLLGEMAFAKISKLPMDLEYKAGGFPYDFCFDLNGESITIDIKTASKLHSYKQMLIYAKTGRGKEIPLSAEYYVAAYLANENIVEKRATVILIGSIHKSKVEKHPIVPAKVGHHWNREINYSELDELDTLLQLIQKEDFVIKRCDC